LQGPLTPEGHEDGEEDGGRVVKEVTGTGCGAGRAQLPVAAGLVTERAHGDIVFLVTHLHAARERAVLKSLCHLDVTPVRDYVGRSQWALSRQVS
jgi:hypothetical protein